MARWRRAKWRLFEVYFRKKWLQISLMWSGLVFKGWGRKFQSSTVMCKPYSLHVFLSTVNRYNLNPGRLIQQLVYGLVVPFTWTHSFGWTIIGWGRLLQGVTPSSIPIWKLRSRERKAWRANL
jgi:hypothetical protein